MKVRIIFACLLIALSFQTRAQRSDKNPLPVMNDGVAYSLPRTGIRIHVTANREKYVAGPYAQYAEAMLGLKGAPASDRESWVITGVEVETFREADPQQVYKANGLAASLVNLTEDGILAGVNVKIETASQTEPGTTFFESPNDPLYPFTDLSLNPFFEKPDSTKRNILIAKTTQEKAQEAAHTITKLRKRRFKTLANAYDEQLPDGKAYAVMVEELGKLEQEYVALFVGKSYTQKFNYTFDYIPGENAVSGDVVFRFSETKGVMPKTDLSGKPVQIELAKIEELASAQSKLKSAGATAGAGSNVYYRMPGKAELKLMNGISLMAVARLDLAQFGTVLKLPEELLDGNHQIEFHPTSGAIKRISVK